MEEHAARILPESAAPQTTRRIVMRRARRIAGMSIAAALALYVALAVRFYTAAPDPSSGGDALAKINATALAARSARDPSDDDSMAAWPLYREAILALATDPPGATAEYTRHPHPGEPGAEEMLAWLDAHEREIAMLRDAATFDRMGFLVQYEYTGLDAELAEAVGCFTCRDDDTPHLARFASMPHVSAAMLVADALLDDARFAAAYGDSGRALDDVLAVFAYAQHLRETYSVRADVHAIAIQTEALRAFLQILAAAPDLFDVDALREMRLALLEIDSPRNGGSPGLIRYEAEHPIIEELLAHLYTDNGDGDGRLAPAGLDLLESWFVESLPGGRGAAPAWNAADPLIAVVIVGRARMRSALETVIDAAHREAKQSFWRRAAIPAAAATAASLTDGSIASLRYGLVNHFAEVSDAAARAESLLQWRDGALVAIALEAHRRQSSDGAYPASLEAAMTPNGWLDAAPIDRQCGRPLRYALSEDGRRPIVYSVGPDLDDDGGRPAMQMSSGISASAAPVEALMLNDPSNSQTTPNREQIPDGDWILYPPAPRSIERAKRTS